MSKSNFLIEVVVQVDSEVEAIQVAHKVAQHVAKVTNEREDSTFAEVGPPGNPCYSVSAKGNVLFKKSKCAKD